MNNINTQTNENVEEAETLGPPPPSSLTTMVECEACGHRLPEANMAIHRARCHTYRRSEPTIHQEEHRLEETGDGSVNEAIEAVDESISGEYVVVPPTTTQQPLASSEATETTSTATPPENQWSCPRCTLFNPNTSNRCEACLYQRGGVGVQNNAINANNNNGPRMHVNVTEVDPQAVSAAVGIASWSIVGALVGGPIGALVAGGTAAVVGGIQHQLQQQRQRQRSSNGDTNPRSRRPFVTVTTTSYSSTPWGGTTMSVTSNASGRRRTMTIRDGERNNNGSTIQLRQMNSADQRILQMLMLNAINQGGATPETANQMTFEELLLQFGFPTDPNHDGHHHGRRQGATPELIDQCSTLETLETKESVSILKDNQATCNICLEEFKQGDNMRKLNHCSHTFHKECIDRWLSQVPSCPICKHDLNDQHQHQHQQCSDGPSSSPSSSTTRAPTESSTSSSSSSPP